MSEQNVKKRGRPPKVKVDKEQNAESVISEQNNINKEYEFNTYTSKYNGLSYHYFGFNIFDYYTPETLQGLLKDPIANNGIVREISKVLYSTNGCFTNTVDYLKSMPTLDKVIVTHGSSIKKKTRNKELMESTLRTIKHKEIIRDALFRGMIEGVAFYYFETTKRNLSKQKYMSDYEVDSIIEINELEFNASVISLPVDYTKIVGIKNSAYTIAFDLTYFNQYSGKTRDNKLLQYPKEIRDAYTKWHKTSKSDGNWCILDNRKTIVHKIRSDRSEQYGRPIVLAAINDILYSDYFTETKRNVLDEINNKIIFQTFPEGKEKGSSALTKNQQKTQHDAVKGAVLSKNNRGGTSFFSVAAGTKISALDASNTDIFNEKYESNLNDKIALAMGISGSLLNGVGSGSYSTQTSNLELITAQLFEWVEQISAELNKCISYNIIKDNKNWVECCYLPITHVNKTAMVGYCKDLYLQGRGSLSLWVASCGLSPDAFFALLDEELENGYEEKYPVHQTSYTLSKNDVSDNKGGRPKTDNPADATVVSQNYNTNDMPKPSTDN